MIFCAHTQEGEWLVDINDPILPVLAASYMSVLAVIHCIFFEHYLSIVVIKKFLTQL